MKRKIYTISILSFLLFLLTLQSIRLVTARTESFTDPEDDVWCIDEEHWNFEKGDYHDEIDITSIGMADNYFNATFAANFSGPFLQIAFYLFENYDPDNEILEYGIGAANDSGVFRGIYFERYVPTGVPETYLVEVWTGTGWSSNILDGLNIGNITGNLFEGMVPPAAWTVPDNITWYVETIAGRVNGEVYYYDVAPNEFEQFPTGGDDEIPAYNLFIFICALSGIVIYIAAKRIKKK